MAGRPPELVRRSQPLLGTFVTITAYGRDRVVLDRAVSAAFAEFQRVDERMSVHRSDSELSRVNAAAIGPVAVSVDLFAVVEKAQQVAAETDGAFDITTRPFADLWGFLRREYRLPAQAELYAVLPRVNWRLVEVDAAAHTIRFRAPGVSMDLGGIAKGFAVDRAIERLRAFGVTNAMVKAGGDLRVVGAPPGQTRWTVQLEDPRKADDRAPGSRIALRLRDAALSTSGNYENFFEVGGRRYAHILDPRTGWPVEGVAACSVIAPTCLESDAWATALFVLGPAEALGRFSHRLAFRITHTPDPAAPEEWPVVQSSRWTAAVD